MKVFNRSDPTFIACAISTVLAGGASYDAMSDAMRCEMAWMGVAYWYVLLLAQAVAVCSARPRSGKAWRGLLMVIYCGLGLIVCWFPVWQCTHWFVLRTGQLPYIYYYVGGTGLVFASWGVLARAVCPNQPTWKFIGRAVAAGGAAQAIAGGFIFLALGLRDWASLLFISMPALLIWSFWSVIGWGNSYATAEASPLETAVGRFDFFHKHLNWPKR